MPEIWPDAVRGRLEVASRSAGQKDFAAALAAGGPALRSRGAQIEALLREQHQGMQRLVRDLNRLHKELPPLHDLDFDGSGFEWIDCNDNSQSVLSFLRKDREGGVLAAVFNFTPVPREGYRIGVPEAGFYREAMNSDADIYSGSNVGNSGGAESEAVPWMNREYSIPLDLPPLGGLILVYEPPVAEEQKPEAEKEAPEETETVKPASVTPDE